LIGLFFVRSEKKFALPLQMTDLKTYLRPQKYTPEAKNAGNQKKQARCNTIKCGSGLISASSLLTI
jgi:hypothetical protein